MKKAFIKVSLFISSFVPLYLLVILKTLIEIVNGNLHFNITNTTLLILMGALSILGFLGVAMVIKGKNNISKITIIDFNNTTDQHFLGYFSLFVLFALTFDLSKVSMSIVYVIILVLIGVVYVRNGLFSINPLLNIIGYSCYNVKCRDEKGNESCMSIYFKGKLNCAKYEISTCFNNVTFVVKQIINH